MLTFKAAGQLLRFLDGSITQVTLEVFQVFRACRTTERPVIWSLSTRASIPSEEAGTGNCPETEASQSCQKVIYETTQRKNCTSSRAPA